MDTATQVEIVLRDAGYKTLALGLHLPARHLF